jgi:small subunit ribosomal protein S4e
MKEVSLIVMQRLIKVDGKVRTDTNYPLGFMDTVTIEKTGQNFRLMLDTKGRFAIVPISAKDSNVKLCRVVSTKMGKKGIPYLTTHDGRTVRYPDPEISANDTIKLDIAENKVIDLYKFEVGQISMATGGFNAGRVGVITYRERHPGGYDIVHLKDAKGNEFATRINNVFVVGDGSKAAVQLPKGKGIRLSIAEEKEVRIKKQSA